MIKRLLAVCALILGIATAYGFSGNYGQQGPAGPSGPTGATGPAGSFAAGVPPWLYFTDAGTEADPNNNATLQGLHRYSTSFTVPVGKTITISNNAASLTNNPPIAGLWIQAPTCTIAGTIDGHGLLSAAVTYGASGGGGGGDNAEGNDSTTPDSQVLGNGTTVTVAAGGTAGAIHVAGGAGSTASALGKAWLLTQAPDFTGQPIGGGAGGGTFTNNQEPGFGGGFLVLDCGTMDFQSTAVVNLSGTDGAAGTADCSSCGGYGGGAGGIFIAAAHVYTHSPSNTGTVNLAGGTGGAAGTGAGAGGNGAAGWHAYFSM